MRTQKAVVTLIGTLLLTSILAFRPGTGFGAPESLELAGSQRVSGGYALQSVKGGQLLLLAETDVVPVGRSRASHLYSESGTIRVSMPPEWADGHQGAYNPAVSSDGRYVTFSMLLALQYSPRTKRVFVRDLVSATTTEVSKASDGSSADRDAIGPDISADGRYVVFYSDSCNLAPYDLGLDYDVFLHDRTTSTTTIISEDPGGHWADSGSPSISADGRDVGFSSVFKFLESDKNYESDVYVYDRFTAQMMLASVALDGFAGNDGSSSPDLSADGRYVTFHSLATDLVLEQDTNNTWDVFRYDAQSNTVELVSKSINGSTANRMAVSPSISYDGRYVVFYSTASDIVAGDTNGVGDVFFWDDNTGDMTRVSIASDGSEANDWSRARSKAAVSADGQYVTFVSAATDLVAGDTNEHPDVFLHDRATGNTFLVSRAYDGSPANGESYEPVITADGAYIVYRSDASNLVVSDTNGVSDIFLRPVAGIGPVNVVSGQILDGDGEPVSSVLVRSQVGLTGTTSASGTYTIAGLPNGTHTITPEKTEWDFLPVSRVLSIPPDVSDANFTGFRTDSAAPAVITDLAVVTGASRGEVILSWAAPGDDNDSGAASAYTVRHAGTPINTELGWLNATDVPGEPMPQLAGTPQSMTVSGLTPGQTYYFVIRAEDEVGNVSALSNSPSFAYSGFWPNPHAYEFHNGSIKASSWDLFKQTFGAENVEWEIHGEARKRPLAVNYFIQHYLGTGTQGNCSGMATSSALLYQGWADPADFLTQQHVDQVFLLPEPGLVNDRWIRSEIVAFLVRYQGYQQGMQVKLAHADARSQTPTELSDILKAAISDGSVSPRYIAILGPYHGECAGHALIPYAYQQSGDIVQIFVYDSNHPGSTQQYVEIDLAADTWTYDNQNDIGKWSYGQTCLTDHDKPVASSFVALSLSAWSERPQPPWLSLRSVGAASNGENQPTYYEFSVGDGASLLIENAQGQGTGVRGGQIVEELPDSYVWIPEASVPGLTPSYAERYIISSTVPLTLSVLYDQATSVPVYTVMPDAQVEIVGVANSGSVTDTIHISPDGLSTRVKAGSSGAGRAITFTREYSLSGYEISISDFDLESEGIGRVDIGAEGCGIFTFTATSAQDSYAINLAQTDFTPSNFIGIGPEMVAGDTHTIRLDCDHPVTATVEIDHLGDGTIDEVVILENQARNYVYLPLVMRR